MTADTKRDMANYDYLTGLEMRPRPASPLDVLLAGLQTTVPDGAVEPDSIIDEDIPDD